MWLEGWGFQPGDSAWPSNLWGGKRGMEVEFMWPMIQLIIPHNETPIKTCGHWNSGEPPRLVIHINMPGSDTSWSHRSFMFRTLPDLNLCVSNWLVLTCTLCNKTVTISVAFFLSSLRSSRKPWMCSQLVRCAGGLGSPQPAAGRWSMDNHLEDCALNL